MQMMLRTGEGKDIIFNLGPKTVFRRTSAHDIRALKSSVFVPTLNTKYLKLQSRIYFKRRNIKGQTSGIANYIKSLFTIILHCIQP